MDRLDAIKIFVRVVESGSFSAVAPGDIAYVWERKVYGESREALARAVAVVGTPSGFCRSYAAQKFYGCIQNGCDTPL
jgi:hypothetical protein